MESLSIQAVSKIIGITPFTLRAWEKRYRILKPKRSENGRRRYSMSDVERLRVICALRSAGHSLPDISKLNMRELNQLLVNTSEGPQGSKQVFVRPLAPRTQIENLMTALKNMDLDQLDGQLKMARLQLDTKSFLLEVIVPFLRTIGTEVEEGRLDVFHEHAVSALMKHLLTGILFATERATDFFNQSPIIFSTPERDHHEFGALIASVLATVNGFRVFYLGPNMPAESLAKATAALNSPLVVVACSAPEEAVSREHLRRFFQSLTQQLPQSTSIWMGGCRIQELPSHLIGLREGDLMLKNLEKFDRILRVRGQHQPSVL